MVFSRYINYWKDGGVLWDNIPSTVVVFTGKSSQGGFGYEKGKFVESGYAVNFVSGEFAYTVTNGSYEYLGTPQGISEQVYTGVESYYGATSLDSIMGDSKFKGTTTTADVFGQITGTDITGESVNQDGTTLIDPLSNRPVKFEESSVGVGLNIFPNLRDVGAISGESYTWVNRHPLYYYRAPWWPFRGQE